MVRLPALVLVFFAAIVAFFAFSAPAEARGRAAVVAQVDVSSQTMTVKVGGAVRHVWKVSTGRKGYVTPRGSYAPKRLHAAYFSKKYAGAPMPYAVFFRGGYAVHGTYEGGKLGAPASHGCIRLAVGHAKQLYHLIKQTGPGATRIVIT